MARGKVIGIAEKITIERRKDSKLGKLDDPALRSYVIRRLGNHWSPEQISGRLKIKAPNMYVSHTAVYDFVYDRENNKLRLWEFLRHPNKGFTLSSKPV